MDPLAQLRDITIPLQPEWWPPAPGWWLLLMLGIVLLAWAARMFKQTRDKKFPFVQARLSITGHHEAFMAKTIESAEYVEQLNQLLKRAALYAHGNSRAASLSGQKWLAHLDELSQSTAFTAGPGQALGNLRYRKNTQFELSDLHTQVLLVISVLEKQA